MRVVCATLGEAGFSLLEVLIAMGFVAIAAMTVVQLFVAGLSVTTEARDESIATWLAVQKMEQLRFVSASSADMVPSPANALEISTAGYSDVVDVLGRPVVSTSGVVSAVYLRRWAIRPAGPHVVVQVLVTTPRREGDGTRGPRLQRNQGEAFVSMVRRSR